MLKNLFIFLLSDHLNQTINRISKEIQVKNQTIGQKIQTLISETNKSLILNEKNNRLNLENLNELEIYASLQTKIEQFKLSDEIATIILGNLKGFL